MPPMLAHPVANGVDVHSVGSERNDREQRVADDPKVVLEAFAELLFEVLCCADDLLGRLGVAAVRQRSSVLR